MAREKVGTDLEPLEFQKFLDVFLTKSLFTNPISEADFALSQPAHKNKTFVV